MSVDPELVATAFGLGRPEGELRPAARGELGIIWHLATDRGEWAVKELLAPEGETGSDLEIQLAALAAGLPLPRPILAPGAGPIVVCGPAAVRVYQWVDLDPVRSCPPGAAGELLAGIHRLGVPAGESHWYYFQPLGPGGWRRLEERTRLNPIAPWADPLAGLLGELERAERDWVSGVAPGPGAVRGHMDFNRDNVRVLRDGRPVILDWENAAATDAAHEVAMAAVEFLVGAGPQGDAGSDLEPAVSFVDGYRGAGGRFDPAGLAVFAMALVCQAHLLDLYSERACDPKLPDHQRRRATEKLGGMTGRPLNLDLALRLLDLWAA